MNTATAATTAINTLYADQQADYAAEIAALAPAFRDVMRSIRAWRIDDRAIACSTTRPDGPADLHAHIAAEALDCVSAWLDESPYSIPDTAEITSAGPRTYVLRW